MLKGNVKERSVPFPSSRTNELDGDAMMNATEGFEDQQTGILHEFIGTTDEEKVVVQHIGTVAQFLLRAIEIEMNVKTFEKLGDRIAESVRFLKRANFRSFSPPVSTTNLLNDFDQFFQRSFVLLSRIDDHGSSQISEKMRRSGL